MPAGRWAVTPESGWSASEWSIVSEKLEYPPACGVSEPASMAGLNVCGKLFSQGPPSAPSVIAKLALA